MPYPANRKGTRTEAERFWPKVRQEGDCWIWQAALNNKGYGMFGRAPVPGKPGRPPLVLAHRWAYEEMIGEIPEGLELDHLCRNPACVNPYHADPVTHEINCRRGTAGEVAARLQRAKTHCPHGHEYTPENIYPQGNNGRACRECTRIRNRGRRLAKSDIVQLDSARLFRHQFYLYDRIRA